MLFKAASGGGGGYATWDSATKGDYITLSGGDLVATNTSPTVSRAISTVGVSSGKWYFEFELVSGIPGNKTGVKGFGVSSENSLNVGNNISLGTYSIFLYPYGNQIELWVQEVQLPDFMVDYYESGDIVNIALDMDNGAIYFGRNGNWQRGIGNTVGIPTSGASRTGAISIWDPIVAPRTFYFVGGYVAPNVYTANFGQTAFSIGTPTDYNSGLYS